MPDIEELLASIEPYVKRSVKQLKRHTRENAPSFRAFALLDPKEVVQTRVIAALLNPFGTHGQCGTFLRLFLKKVKEEVAPQDGMIDFAAILSLDDLRDTEVITEHLTRVIESDRRRIDLVVRLPQNTIVAIESKARGAKDQRKQLEDYRKYLQNIDVRFLLIYLSSGEAGAAKEVARLCEEHPRTVVKVSYQNFISSWLDECKRNCSAKPVQIFLDDFKNYLSDKEVQMDKAEIERVLKAATRDDGKLRSAFAVIDAQCEIGKTLGRRFIEQLESKIRSRLSGEWELKCDFGTEPDYPILKLKRKHWGKMSVAFELHCETAWPDDMGFGINGGGKQNASHPQPFDDKKMKLLESKHLLNGRKKDTWRCFKSWQPRGEQKIDTALLLLNPPNSVLNELAERLIGLAKDLDGVLTECREESQSASRRRRAG